MSSDTRKTFIIERTETSHYYMVLKAENEKKAKAIAEKTTLPNVLKNFDKPSIRIKEANETERRKVEAAFTIENKIDYENGKPVYDNNETEDTEDSIECISTEKWLISNFKEKLLEMDKRTGGKIGTEEMEYLESRLKENLDEYLKELMDSPSVHVLILDLYANMLRNRKP